MEIYKEPIHYQNPVLCMKVWQFGYQPDPAEQQEKAKGSKDSRELKQAVTQFHYHNEVEFILVHQGVHQIVTPQLRYTLEPEDVMVLGSSRLHSGAAVVKEDLSYTVLHVDLEPYFDPSMMVYYRNFLELKYPMESLNDMFREDVGVRKEVGRIIQSLYDEINLQPRGYEIAASMHMKHLLLTLLRGDQRGLLQLTDELTVSDLRPMLYYIEEHLTSKLDLDEMSRMMGMSYSYLSKYFKRAMGVSFTDYIQSKRMDYAEGMLREGRRAITDVAREIGYENMAHFYTLFKRYKGVTPGELVKVKDVNYEITWQGMDKKRN